MKESEPRRRPVLIYDGECRFCCRWIGRWESITGDRVEYVASQEAAARFPEISPEDFAGSVQLVDTDGRRYQHAEAVFRSLAVGSARGRALLWAYRAVPGFAGATDGAYRFIAAHRGIFSRLTTWLWGSDVRPPTYGISTWLFLRLLALVYLIAFGSHAVQAMGLTGSGGILPVADLLPRAREALGAEAVWRLPTLLWVSSSDAMLMGLSVAGVVLAVLLMAGIAPPLVLAALWAGYLSLVVAGQVFYSFQWDILLLEAGFLAIFLAPWRWRTGLRGMESPHPFARFLMVWLLFRFLFSSGVVKLTSGDAAWWDLTALDYHYWTQPIPNAVAWTMAKLPLWFQKASALGMFGIELIVPFFVFLPRRSRMVAFFLILALQVSIELTGNYGFFNLLAAALAVLLVDDAVFGRWSLVLGHGSPVVGRWPSRWILIPVGVAYLAISLVPLAGAFRRPVPILEPLAHVYEWVAPFRTINGYGLFAVMTKDRPEILVQGSEDGVTWENYVFRFKPGPAGRMPPFVAPYMPRLDWQMWFAALGDVRENPWFVAFLAGLLEAKPDVLALLDRDPFEGRKPRFVRAMLDDYTFTTLAEKRETGAWWKAEPRAIYVREISLEDLR